MENLSKPTMMTYINQEQEILDTIISNYPSNLHHKLEGNRWLILATGSSFNAAMSAKYYIEKISDVYVSVEEPFKFQYYEKLRPEIDVVIGVSQSGESTSTIEAIKSIKSKKPEITTIALTSKLNSEITEVVDQVVDIEIGEEKVGYVTKGFSATVLKLMLMGLNFSKSKHQIDANREEKELNQFKNSINSINDIILKTEDFYKRWSLELVKAPRFMALGCGSVYGTALEMQTKFCETVREPSQGMDIEMFMHGPYLEINPNHQLFFIETPSQVKYRLENLRNYEQKYVNNIYTVSLGKSENDRTIGLDLDIDEYKAPLFLIIPFQILAYNIAEDKGNNLSKRIYTDFGVAMKSKTRPGDYV